ncbi:hypothetical protein [Kordia jejudonensis]|uniref:hypothetical protein n=1 Tax=Kordia jejudonensis TaxID=1348245 RepID=UPI0006295603|nr:hypothetical protein [Kordia jejudonensis]
MLSTKKAIVLLAFFTITFSFAQEKIVLKNIDQIDISDLTKDIQIVKKNKDNFKMIWWIPTEYWEVVMNGSRIVNSKDINSFVTILDEYVLVASMNSELTAYGNFKPKYSNIQILDKSGTVYDELEESEISAEYLEVLSVLKPSMTQTLGELGKQLKFHVFKKRDKQGKLITPMTEFSKFSIVMNQKSRFNIKLPLASMVEEKMCPEDDELVNGNWKYCPWHGKKLKLQTK